MLPSIDDVAKQFGIELSFGENRVAAEYAYALAIRLRDAGKLEAARSYARQCVQLLEGLPCTTIGDVASERASVGGVPLPELFHDGVARSRLRDLLPADGAEAGH
jgi:hypothetical protein